MSDRDDLALMIAHPKRSPTGMVTDPMPDECDRCADALRIADAVLAAGFRRTVTPEQIEAVDRLLRKVDTVEGVINSAKSGVNDALRELDNIRRAVRGLSVDGAE